ncbi:MAG: response regulator [Deltaproteobacteria bacterium]|jgi:two-component system phosphate regulon response regulator PhoB|nr:response regulator [Deltaproteobacteria bacterium]NTV57367.1 response regulator [Deltaproteobacteria bacterium]
MAKQKILAVDDEEDILELLRFNLTKEGFAVVCAGSGEEALKLTRLEKPELILLDLLLPGMDGLEVARRLKKDASTKEIPIIMVTAKGEEADIVTGLEVGAEDYITKPFSRKVVIARVRAVLRRKTAAPADDQEVVTVHDLAIHPGRREVLVKGKPVSLTFTEFGILNFLSRRPGWVFTRSQIVDAVKGDEYFVTDRAVDVQIVGLRKKLGSAAKVIETVRGVGYRFKE